MPRSADAATQFTSTTPQATSHLETQIPRSAANLRPSTPPKAAQKPNIPNGAPSKKAGPPGETPMQKVARLKAAAARGKAAQVSTFDKVIVVGRRVADTAHKVTALSLIAFSAVTGAVTIYALGDMIIYNRRKRREYYAEQKALHSSALFEAQKAIQAGHATEAQHAIVEEEFKYMQEVKAQANKPGVWARGKEWLFSGMKKENTGEISDELVKQAVEDSTETINIPEPISSYNGTSEMLKAVDNKKDDIQSRAKSAFDKERELQKIGGPLDRLGTAPEGPYAEGGQYADGKSKGSGGWTSFMTRK